MSCSKCGFACPPQAAYCQKCGGKLKQSGLSWSSTKSWAGVGTRGTSIAPLVSLSVENQAKKQRPADTAKALAPVLQPTGAHWYCPSCGEPTQQGASFCKGCGRDFG